VRAEHDRWRRQAYRPVRPARQPVDVGTVHRLLLKEQDDERIELAAMRLEQVDRSFLGLPQQLGDLAVDGRLGR